MDTISDHHASKISDPSIMMLSPGLVSLVSLAADVTVRAVT